MALIAFLETWRLPDWTVRQSRKWRDKTCWTRSASAAGGIDRSSCDRNAFSVCGVGARCPSLAGGGAHVAQSVEDVTEITCVGGSIPPLDTVAGYAVCQH